VTPSPRFIEPAIAPSIAYVGVENFLVKDPEKRWRMTLPCGFIHGFGFAGALVERHLPCARLPLARFGFNSGVEAGQLAVLALALPLVLGARHSRRFRREPRASAREVLRNPALTFCQRAVEPADVLSAIGDAIDGNNRQVRDPQEPQPRAHALREGRAMLANSTLSAAPLRASLSSRSTAVFAAVAVLALGSTVAATGLGRRAQGRFDEARAEMLAQCLDTTGVSATNVRAGSPCDLERQAPLAMPEYKTGQLALAGADAALRLRERGVAWPGWRRSSRAPTASIGRTPSWARCSPAS